MRTILKNIFIGILGALANGVVTRYKPEVVMITGSVGKTSTKDAVAAVLSKSFYVRKSEKGYNSEIGVPLTIIGARNPWANPIAWLGVFGKALGVLCLPNHYPKVLVLEVGADHPGDLAHITRIVKPTGVVVTLLPEVPVHVEAYTSPAAVREEEFFPAMALPAGAPLVICADDHHAADHATRTQSVRIKTFGYAETADVRVTNLSLWKEGTKVLGMQAELTIAGTSYPIHVAQAFGRTQLYAPAAAVAFGLSFGMTIEQAIKGLSRYVSPPGRGKLFAGIKETTLIDDSYNASPIAVEEILYSLSYLSKEQRKVAILGDMLELGRYSIKEHERMGKIAKDSVDVLITVGSRAQAIASSAQAAGMPENCVHVFATAEEALSAIPEILAEHDVVLIKGSQGVRTERITRSLLADTSDIDQLVRQDDQWHKR